MVLKVVKESEPIKVERINLRIYGGVGRPPPLRWIVGVTRHNTSLGFRHAGRLVLSYYSGLRGTFILFLD
jgi:hypothetical protein